MTALMIPGSLRKWPSLTSYFQRGTTPKEIWYALGAQNQAATATASYAVDVIRAHPFILSRPVRVDRLGFEVTTGGGAGSVARCGIYKTKAIDNIYPGALVVDAGEEDANSVAVHSNTVDVLLPSGLYWAAFITGVGAPTLRRFTGAAKGTEMGAQSTLANLLWGLSKAQAYGALPNSFPASATAGNAATLTPIIGARFSG